VSNRKSPDDRRLASQRTEAGYSHADRRNGYDTEASRRSTRAAKRAWSRANRRHGKALTKAPW
jgi:hypothetical protein